MPDITMCNDLDCPLAEQCYRSARMTEPDVIQSWFMYSPRNEDNTCDQFWSVNPPLQTPVPKI